MVRPGRYAPAVSLLEVGILSVYDVSRKGLQAVLRNAQEAHIRHEQVDRMRLGAVRSRVRADRAADVARGRGRQRENATDWGASGRGRAVLRFLQDAANACAGLCGQVVDRKSTR